jgi:hypothetical protein
VKRGCCWNRREVRLADLSFPLLLLSLEATGLDPRLAAWLREYWHFPIDLRPAERGVLRLNTIESPGPSDFDALPWDGQASLPGIALPCAHHDGAVWIGGPASGVRLVQCDGDIELDIWGPAHSGGNLYAALFLALAEAVRWTGLVPLHAAIVARDGEATALLGRSGTGKSTTLLRATELGWSVLAEDFAWLEPQTGTVYGWDRGVHVWPDTLRCVVPQFAGYLWSEVHGGKLFLPFERLAASTMTSARLTRIMMLQREGQSTQFDAASTGDVARALWECTGVPLTSASRAATAAVIARLLRGTEFRVLTIGTQPLLL